MNVGKTLFAQVMEFVPWTSFARIVDRYSGNAGVRCMNCAEQFRVMAFAQLTWRESLRDIEVTLGANAHKLYLWGCETMFIAPRWQTRTIRATGVFGSRWPCCSFVAHANFTATTIWNWD